MRKHRRRAAIASILVIISLVCGLFLQAPVLKAKGDEDDEDEYYLVNCTEKEAYEKGYDYYRAWYICNKGNYCQLYYGYQPPYHSVVTKNRRDQSYQYEVWQWRVLTFNLSELTAHSVKENAYCEALLFNLLYDEDSASMFDTATNDATGAIGEINKTVKNTGISAWKKLGKGIYKGDVWDAYSKIEGKSVAEIEELVKEANKTSELNDIIGDFSDAAKIIDTCATAGDYITGLTKVAQLVGKSNDMSHILADMSADTTNTAYSAALDNFSAYLSESITKDEANQIFTGAMGTREALDKAVDAIWGAVCKKNVAAAGIAVGSSVGKFLSNTLTGNDDQYNKFNELEVYYDIERLLHNEVDNLIYKIDDGDEVAARRFLVAYGMLKNMYNISLDCYESYADKMYKAGFLNMAFPGINGNKYENAMTICENLRTAVNNLFYADMAEADKAYQAAERKFDDTDSGVVVNNTVPTTIEEDRETCKEHRDTFTYVINKNTVVDRDKEIYGSVMLDSGALDLNGHKLTVYGSAFLTGKLTVNGVLDVKGDVYQYDSSMELTGASTVMVGGNYYQRGGSLSVRGGSLTVGGDHEIGYLDAGGNPIYDEHTMFYVDEDGQIKIGGSFIVHKLYSSSCEKGTMEVGKSVQVGAEDGTYLYGKSGFTLTLSGTSDVRIENVSGINLVIKNAAERNITMAGLVGASGLSGGAMTIHPEKLRFSAAMENDVVIDGDAEICGNVFLKTHSLTINGSLTHTGGGIGDPYYDKDSASVSDTGTLNVKGNVTQRDGSLHLSEGGNALIAGNYYQRGGSVSVSGGSLTAYGDHEIGYLDADGNPLYDDHTMFSVTEDGQVKIGGGFTAHKLYSSYCEKGTMEVGKGVQAGAKDDSSLDGKSGFTLTLCGTADARIENVNGMKIVIENAAERTITMAGLIGPSSLGGGDLTVSPENLRFYGGLENDVVIDGDVEICGNLSLNGHSLTVKGNMLHTYGSLELEKGTLQIGGDYTAAVKTSDGYGQTDYAGLSMANPEDQIIVGGDMLVYTERGSQMTDGVLEVKGDFTQKGENSYAFAPSQNHVTRLSGTTLQRITFEADTKFNRLELGQYEENYVFTPEECWVTKTVYCPHTDKEVRGRVEATCMEDGYSGDTYCASCGILLEQGSKVRAEGHKIVEDPSVEPTCTEAGKTAGRHCSVCGQVLKEQTEIPAKGHVWDQGTVTKVPTAGEKGVKTYTCTVCGQTRIEELDAEGGQGSTEQTGNPGGQGSTEQTGNPGGQGSTEQTGNPGGQGSTEQTGNPGGQGSTEANPASQDATEKPENPTEQRTTEKSSEPSTQAATQAQTTQGGQASTEKPAKDHATKLNLANKKTYKFSKKVTIKDADGLKTVKVNGKTLKVKNGKKSCSFKLSTFKKYLRKGKWNKLVVTDLAGRKKTIKFKVR